MQFKQIRENALMQHGSNKHNRDFLRLRSGQAFDAPSLLTSLVLAQNDRG